MIYPIKANKMVFLGLVSSSELLWLKYSGSKYITITPKMNSGASTLSIVAISIRYNNKSYEPFLASRHSNCTVQPEECSSASTATVST